MAPGRRPGASWVVPISPLPSNGDVLAGADVPGRWLRVSAHPEAGRVVLSLWQDDVCRATFRVAPEGVSDLVALLTRSAVAAAEGVRDLGQTG